MPKPRPKSADDINDLLVLIKAGRLFEVQAWIADGNRVRDPSNEHAKFCPLYQSVEVGFHSLVQVVLTATEWAQDEKDDALNAAMSNRRLDLVDLLLASGAQASAINFSDVCQTVDTGLMERFLRLGVDPAKDNAFARSLDDIKARPLLGFYRSFRYEFPSLHPQASLALVEAVEQKKHRWAALLAWAGADPFMQVPESLYHGWEFEDYNGRSAAEKACWSEDGELVKALKLRPTSEQAQELLRRAGWFPCVAVFEQLLRVLPKEQLNVTERRSCVAVEQIVERHNYDFLGSAREQQKDDSAVASLEFLLDHGARWNPEPGRLSSIRRTLAKHSANYIIRVLRLLLYTAGAAEESVLRELCRTPVLRDKIASMDKPLAQEFATKFK